MKKISEQKVNIPEFEKNELLEMISKMKKDVSDGKMLTESEQASVDELSEKLATLLKEGKENNAVEEGLFSAALTGAAGYMFGPAIGKAICKALGVEKGLLFDLLNSKMFTTMVAAYMGNKF